MLVPEFAHLAAFWVWVAAVATLALSYVVFGSSGSGADAKGSRGAEAEIDRGEIPKFAWVLLGFTIFWIAVSAINRIAPADAALRASRDSLTSYVNDRAHVLSGYEAQRLTLALQNFEATTPSQIAVAIYPRAPTARSTNSRSGPRRRFRSAAPGSIPARSSSCSWRTRPRDSKSGMASKER